MFKKSLLVVILAGVMSAVPAMAGQQDFTLHNNSSHILKNLYVTPSKSNEWGSDILGEDQLNAGESVTVHFDRDESVCHWDVKGDFDNGGSAEVDDVDFCTVSEVNFHD